MKPEIKAAWIAALRSGNYTQGKSSLRSDDDKFCCLGVLCDLHSRATGTDWSIDVRNDFNFFDYLGSKSLLPRPVVEWAGLHPDHCVNGSVRLAPTDPDGEGLLLTLLNDVYGKTFEEIAAVIESEIPAPYMPNASLGS